MADTTPTTSAPPVLPVQGFTDLKSVTPFIGPVLAMLGSRKGIVMLGVLIFCGLVYWRDPAQRTWVLGFLALTVPMYFHATATEDKAQHEAAGALAVAHAQNAGDLARAHVLNDGEMKLAIARGETDIPPSTVAAK